VTSASAAARSTARGSYWYSVSSPTPTAVAAKARLVTEVAKTAVEKTIEGVAGCVTGAEVGAGHGALVADPEGGAAVGCVLGAASSEGVRINIAEPHQPPP
jgi:hypothetical protein